MYWIVVAPFIKELNDFGWLTIFVLGERNQFRSIPYRAVLANRNWHNLTSSVIGYTRGLESGTKAEKQWKRSRVTSVLSCLI